MSTISHYYFQRGKSYTLFFRNPVIDYDHNREQRIGSCLRRIARRWSPAVEDWLWRDGKDGTVQLGVTITANAQMDRIVEEIFEMMRELEVHYAEMGPFIASLDSFDLPLDAIHGRL